MFGRRGIGATFALARFRWLAARLYHDVLFSDFAVLQNESGERNGRESECFILPTSSPVECAICGPF